MLCCLLKVLNLPKPIYSLICFPEHFHRTVLLIRGLRWEQLLPQHNTLTCPFCRATVLMLRLVELSHSPTAHLWEERGWGQWRKGRHRTLPLMCGPSTTFKVQHIILSYTIRGCHQPNRSSPLVDKCCSLQTELQAVSSVGTEAGNPSLE